MKLQLTLIKSTIFKKQWPNSKIILQLFFNLAFNITRFFKLLIIEYFVSKFSYIIKILFNEFEHSTTRMSKTLIIKSSLFLRLHNKYFS
jgi:hypothetical protein